MRLPRPPTPDGQQALPPGSTGDQPLHDPGELLVQLPTQVSQATRASQPDPQA